MSYEPYRYQCTECKSRQVRRCKAKPWATNGRDAPPFKCRNRHCRADLEKVRDLKTGELVTEFAHD